MNSLETFGRAVKLVFGDPKFRAQIEWMQQYGLCAQLERQWPREEMEDYATTGQHPNPARGVRLAFHEMPDFDWWEPRHDQPWRRQNARANAV